MRTQLTAARRAGRAVRARRADEQGSLIIAVTVIMIVVLLSSVLMMRVIGNEQIVVSRQSTYGGVSGANAGLSDALFQLDQGDAPSSGVLCLNALNPSDTNCTVKVSSTATPQLSGISYVARLTSSGALAGQTWTVQALGNASTGMKGAVQEKLTRASEFPFALFGKTSLGFKGNTSKYVNFGTFTPGTGTFTPCPSTATNPPCLYLGTDGSITCTGPSPSSVEGVFYNTGSGGGADSCGTSQSGGNVSYPVPDPTTPSPNAGCPFVLNGAGTEYEGGDAYGVPTIAPGTYVCDEPVTVSGSLQDSSTTDPVKLYIMLSPSSYGSKTTFLSMGSGSTDPTIVNTTITPSEMSSGSGPPAGATMPDSTLFQVYSNSTGVMDTNGSSDNFTFAGILYAPEASLTANGCKNYYFGALVINTFLCNGGPNLAFYYDSNLAYDWGPWQVSGYTQINPKSVSIP